jgi:hypothetical protein
MKVKTTSLGIAPSRHAFDKIRVLVSNRFGVKVGGVPGQGRDTDFSYYLSTDDRLTKAQLQSLNDYIAGIIDTIKSY